MIHLHIRIPLGREKEGKVTLCDGVDRPGEHYAEWSKPVRGRQGPYDFTRVWNLIRKNKLANKIETGSQVFPLLYTGERGTGMYKKEHTKSEVEDEDGEQSL